MSDNQQSCGCGGSCKGMDRREFLRTAGAGLATLTTLGTTGPAMAGPFFRSADGGDHFVPADKRLTKEWLASLYAKGAPRVCRGTELNLIGMPIGGIGAGQVYICGDGTLACWKIFNQTYFSGYGADNYNSRMPDKPIAQGFAIVVEEGDTKRALQLNRQDFPDVEFTGEYPLARVRYSKADLPVRVELTAFSPFIPLNARDSALPATIFAHAVENTGSQPLKLTMLGWLDNAVCFHSTRDYGVVLQRRSRVITERDRTLLVHSAELLTPKSGTPREDTVLADFEGETYGDWKAEGDAFGDKPAPGTMPNQNPVTGFLGKGLVNSYNGTDDAQGRLTSPEFAISRDYVCFLIGGGRYPGETCINLLIDGKPVRTATGHNDERLLWHSWNVQEFAGKTARIEIVDKRTGPWGHINIDQILQSDQPRFGTAGSIDHLPDFGTMVLALGEPGASATDTQALLSTLTGFGVELQSSDNLAFPTNESPRTPALATRTIELKPGEKKTFAFVVGWHFPNRTEGNMYANWFDSSAAVAHYAFDNHARLSDETRHWHDVYYDSTLPRWLLDRLHYPASTLATGTCLWWKSGRFWAWEGVGCCEGTCTHVWNYAHAMARLFPELERSVREMQDLGAAFHDDGLVGFRGSRNKAYAADGQAGTVLKCYREHLMSADDLFLKKHWPAIRKVLEYSLGQDGNDDGLIEVTQHNTFDINFEGPNTFVGSLYLAALRAGEEMAKAVGDDEFATRVHNVFESGRRLSAERLWNGEYFVQDVDIKKFPKFQYGDGCLADQVFGQGWAHQVGLGYIYPPEQVRKALESIWKYNWAPDVGPQNAAHPPERWFIHPGEAGLLECTWPKSKHLDQGVLYRDEVWTGTEYQVAGHMIWEGMVEQGLAIVRAIHDRYDPLRHNPYNEVECGDHYARAMASWGVYLALCGYEYDGPRGHLAFAPRLSPDDFRAAFTTAQGWGTFTQKREQRSQHARIELKSGQLRLTSLALSTPDTVDRTRVSVKTKGGEVTVTLDVQGEHLTIRFANELKLDAGDTLDVAIG